MKNLDLFEQFLKESRNVVFFGGAGVSTESGIPDFRSEDGLYRQKFRFPPEYMLSHECFERNPEEFFAFYREKMLATGAKPNPAHRKLAEWEREGRLNAVVTQNIDGLHQAAGSRNVFELHGSAHRNHCMRCGKSFPLAFVAESKGVPRCACGGIVKPDVVLYGESLPEDAWRGALREISRADLLIVAGTSLAVYPASSLIECCSARLVVVNLSPTPADDRADLVLRERVGELFSAL